jgi:hypothetical protein
MPEKGLRQPILMGTCMKRALSVLGLTLGVTVALFGQDDVSRGAETAPLVVSHGELGLAISSMAFGLGRDEDASVACPDGMSKGFLDAYRASGGNTELLPNEADQAYNTRMYRLASRTTSLTNFDGLCLNPGSAPDPYFRVVAPVDVPSEGIDLDDQASRANGRAAAGTCAHDDFRATTGTRTIDNQMHRVLGCTTGYQNAGASRKVDARMLAGEWTLLLRLSGVDNLRNDPDVTVGIYSSLDPLQLSAERMPVADATYAADADPRYRATTHGRIVNGVLTTDPVDVRFRWSAEVWRLVRPLRHARLQLTFTPRGAEGFISGYTPIEEWFANNYNYQAALTADGVPGDAGYRWYSAIGTANSQGFTCNGLYQAMQRNADGDRDPATGRCTSLSTQYRIRAIPAFVVLDGH